MRHFARGNKNDSWTVVKYGGLRSCSGSLLDGLVLDYFLRTLMPQSSSEVKKVCSLGRKQSSSIIEAVSEITLLVRHFERV